MKEIISQLQSMKNMNGRINPDRAWVAKNRALLMQQINNTLPEEKNKFHWERMWGALTVFLPNRFVYGVVRPVAVFVLIGAIATSGWIASVSATQNCLPGDVCYGVKLAAEKTQALVVAVAGTKGEATQMHLEFAKRRATEVKKVVENNAPGASGKATVTIEKLEKSIKTAGETLKDAAVSQPENAMEVAKEVKEKTKEINDSLKSVEAQSMAGVSVAEAKLLIKETNLQAVEAVVQSKEDGKINVSTEEVKNLVKDEIKNVSDESAVVNGKVQTAIKDINVQNASTTPAVAVKDVKDVVEGVAKKVDSDQALIQKNINSANVLADNNQLKEALQKVKEVNQVTQQNDKAVVDVQKIVNETAKTTSTLEVIIAPSSIVPILSSSTVQKVVIVSSTLK